jgi:hypothetical protein
MRAWRSVVFAGLLAAVPGLGIAAGLSVLFPDELTPGEQPTRQWERIEGQLAFDGRTAAYVFYVDPRYPGLYRITRYRIRSVTVATDGREVWSDEAEVLIWNSRPGLREPLRCFRLGESGPERWRSISAGSDEYRLAMEHALSLYFGHNARKQARN